MKKAKRDNLIVLLTLVAAIFIISFFLPGRRQNQLVYQQGKPWHYPLLTAPFDIPIERDTATAHKITDSINANFVRIYRYDYDAVDSKMLALGRVLRTTPGVTAAVRQQLLWAVRNLYDSCIVDNETSDLIREGKLPVVRVLYTNAQAREVPTQGMRSVLQAYSWLDSTYSGEAYRQAMSAVQINNYLTPVLTLDSAENKKLLSDAYAAALAPTGMVQAGEGIISRGEIVTPQKYTILRTYEKMLDKRKVRGLGDDYSVLGQALIVAMLLLSLYYFVKMVRWRIFNDLRRMLFPILFIVVFILAVFWVTDYRPILLNAVPFVLVPIIITTFYDSRMALFIHLVVILICSLVAAEQADFIIMQFLAGVVAIASVQELSRRSQLLRCAFMCFMAYSLSYTALYVVHEGNFDNLGWHYYVLFFMNCLVLSFAYFLIFIVEKLFGFTSTVTLVELSEITSPVLRDLSEKCPGTFQHSLQVSNLAVEAAHKIGANMQLVRAGALYHDIGKMKNPAFFTENQNGVNPHDGLTPEQSARIVIAHVTDGLEIAEKQHLPQVIKDFIAQHHGKGMVKYFYSKACKEHPGQAVDPAPFTYPGPNPQSKETGIVMMADACEAAAKSMPEHTEESIEKLVNRIIDGQIADGLMRDTPLSFHDVEVVKKTFVERLRSFYHTRVSYPDDVKPLVKPSGDDTAIAEAKAAIATDEATAKA